MAAIELWTQSVKAEWPPSLAFYDKKLELLHKFDDEGLLRAFRNQQKEIAALLGDRDHQLELEPDAMSIKLLQPYGDVERVERAARAAIATIAPRRIANVSVMLQYLAPLPNDYGASRSSSAMAFLGLGDLGPTSAGPSLQGWDWAILLDGASDRDEARFQVEFGIVSADEIPGRLARQVGRVESAEGNVPSDHWAESDLPDVALFADWSWTGKNPEDLAPLEGILAAWSHAKEDAEHLLNHVLSRIEDNIDQEASVSKEGDT